MGAIRFSLGRATTRDEIDVVVPNLLTYSPLLDDQPASLDHEGLRRSSHLCRCMKTREKPKMGFYQDRIVPYLTDLSMRQQRLAAYRSRVVPAAEGRVLEIGVGSGSILPFYTDRCSR